MINQPSQPSRPDSNKTVSGKPGAVHKDKDAVVWGVDFEDVEKDVLESFLKKVSVNYPILGIGQQPYTPFDSVHVLPTTFFIGPDGKFVRKHEGALTTEKIETIITEQSNAQEP